MSALYDRLGVGYSDWRRPDPRFAAALREALGDARSVVNVGAGAGSYEPRDRRVMAVEPSPRMLEQRPDDAAPAVRGIAEALPFRPRAFEASLAVLTIHHWTDWRAGVRELLRVARKRVVVLTHDTTDSSFTDFWLLRDYLPALSRLAGRGMPPIAELCERLGGRSEVLEVPADCSDGFLAAYWARPERYLDDRVRAAISTFHRLPPAMVERAMARLAADIASGAWNVRNACLLDRETRDFGYRLVVAELGNVRRRLAGGL